MSNIRILQGDNRAVLRSLPEKSVHCVVTSPPYWGLRRYPIPDVVFGGDPKCVHVWGAEIVQKGPAQAQGKTSQRIGRSNVDEQQTSRTSQGALCACGAWRGQLGNEPEPEQYIAHLVEVFREVKRVLRDDGTLWLNLGDSYAKAGTSGLGRGLQSAYPDEIKKIIPSGLKPKDMVGIPWMAAFALRADGWWLRSDIVWAKGISFCPDYSGSVMPDSTTDRPTKSHEFMFLLAKSERYYFDMDAIKEPLAEGSVLRMLQDNFENQKGGPATGRHVRSVWAITAKPYKEAHFAVFPEKLVEPCILAGTSARGACPRCGAPWERVVARAKHPTRDPEVERLETAEVTGRADGHVSGPGGKVDATETVGWRAGCQCASDKPVVPCVVLDPFGGSGTTGRVAEQHGRDAVMIELSEQYIPLIEGRTSEQSFDFGA